eukprot:scpid67594/ scgid35220/ 
MLWTFEAASDCPRHDAILIALLVMAVTVIVVYMSAIIFAIRRHRYIKQELERLALLIASDVTADILHDGSGALALETETSESVPGKNWRCSAEQTGDIFPSANAVVGKRKASIGTCSLATIPEYAEINRFGQLDGDHWYEEFEVDCVSQAYEGIDSESLMYTDLIFTPLYQDIKSEHRGKIRNAESLGSSSASKRTSQHFSHTSASVPDYLELLQEGKAGEKPSEDYDYVVFQKQCFKQKGSQVSCGDVVHDNDSTSVSNGSIRDTASGITPDDEIYSHVVCNMTDRAGPVPTEMPLTALTDEHGYLLLTSSDTSEYGQGVHSDGRASPHCREKVHLPESHCDNDDTTSDACTKTVYLALDSQGAEMSFYTVPSKGDNLLRPVLERLPLEEEEEEYTYVFCWNGQSAGLPQIYRRVADKDGGSDLSSYTKVDRSSMSPSLYTSLSAGNGKGSMDSSVGPTLLAPDKSSVSQTTEN